MKQEALPQGDHKPVVRHHKSGHFAEKLEGYVGVGIVVVAAVLLVLILFFFMQTGNSTPAWMH